MEPFQQKVDIEVNDIQKAINKNIPNQVNQLSLHGMVLKILVCCLKQILLIN